MQASAHLERAHGTHQDRLVKKLRLKAIDSYERANEYFQSEYIAAHNRRFSVSPASPVDYHAPKDRRAIADDDVFCLEATRLVGNDHVVQYGTRGLQQERVSRGRVPAKSRVLVRETEDGRLRVIQLTGEGRDRRERALKWTEAASRTSRIPSASPKLSTSSEPVPKTDRATHKPASDHP